MFVYTPILARETNIYYEYNISCNSCVLKNYHCYKTIPVI